MEEYIRKCPNCGRDIKYSTKYEMNRAHKRNSLCRSCVNVRRYENSRPKLEKLLENNKQSCYWMGVLLTDGHFDGYKIGFVQGIKDEVLVKGFAKYIEYESGVKYSTVKYSYNGEFREKERVTIHASSILVVPQIMEKYDISVRKTYNPPNPNIFEEMPLELLAYMFIGFVDGDGCVYSRGKRFCLSIGMYISWKPILEVFNRRLFDNKGCINCFKSSKNMIHLRISNTNVLRDFKRLYFNDEMCFEPLHRKWDKINENHCNKDRKSGIISVRVYEMFKKGYTSKEIAEVLELSYFTVQNRIRIYKQGLTPKDIDGNIGKITNKLAIATVR